MSEDMENNSDKDLEFTREIRMNFIKDLTKNGTKFPDDPKICNVLLKGLADMDSASLGKKRIGVDTDKNNIEFQAQAILANLMKRPDLRRVDEVVDSLVTRELPNLPETAAHPEIVAGELDINPPQLNYDTFMSKNR